MTVHELAQRHPTAYRDAIAMARANGGRATVTIARDGVTIRPGRHQLPGAIFITTETTTR